MREQHIVVFDDEQPRVEAWVAALQASSPVADKFEAKVLGSEEFRDEWAILLKRQSDCRRNGDPFARARLGDSRFDDLAVLMVDADLRYLVEEVPPLSVDGEEVAYLVRCFSTCRAVVTLNRRGDGPSVDLGLRDTTGSLADAHLPAGEIANAGVWSGIIERSAGSELRILPSYWPRLDRLVEGVDERVATLERLSNPLETPILELLGFPDELAQRLPRYAAALLSPSCRDPRDATVKQFLLESGSCLRPKDADAASQGNPQWLVGLAAARLGHWLERIVLPAQDLLCDLPHAVDRLPSLCLADRKDDVAGDWDLARVVAPHAMDALTEARFPGNCWLSRPAFWWPSLAMDTRLPEVSEPWAIEFPDDVFCEDFSRFFPSGMTRPFLADVVSSHDRRRVLDPEAITEPGLRAYVATVRYQPFVQFLL